MPQDLNQIALVGRLTRAPELRAVGDTHVLQGRLAFSRREKSRGEWQDVSGYVDVTLAWGTRAESLERYLDKGSRIGVTGSLRYREWEKDGAKRSTLEIDARDVQLLDSKGERPAASDVPADRVPAATADDDDSIPF